MFISTILHPLMDVYTFFDKDTCRPKYHMDSKAVKYFVHIMLSSK